MSVRKHVTKLIMALLLTLTSMTLLVGGTYAWFVLSTAPEVSGMKLSIGTKNTIQIAADKTDPEGNHYPGVFGDSLPLEDLDTGALFPVSTADGVHWILPVYGSLEQGKPLTGFREELDLAHANLNEDSNGEGAYIYLDFWVVSPENCKLRVSTSPVVGKEAGSFVVAMPRAVKNGEEEIGLEAADSPAAQAIRLGFLTESSESPESLRVFRSQGGTTKYTKMLGLFFDQGTEAAYAPGKTNFCIYEPNADQHQDETLNGKILITQALSDAAGTSAPLRDRVTVQTAGSWRDLAGQFADKTQGKNFQSVEEAESFLRQNLVQWFPSWLEAGRFVTQTGSLYDRAGDTGTVAVSDLEAASPKLTAGATEDILICSLVENIPQRIRMFIWLEGQDADCVAKELTQELVIHLELAGQTTE